MKIILKSDVDKLGLLGDTKDVSHGYARNYLFPRGLAMAATPSALVWIEKTKDRREKVRAKAIEDAKAAAGKIAEISLSFARPVGEGGKLFGSVGKADIVKSLKASGYDVGKDAIKLDAAIKEIGESEVDIRLAPDVHVKVKVTVAVRS